MSDEDGFLSRWSRRKQAARTEPETPAAEETPSEVAADPQDEVEAAPLDLPPIESLDASSDYTAFLQPRVPAELRLAALRRAWASDAHIAGFRGMADYDWDFNAPGYGKFLAADNVAQLVDAVFGPTPAERADREARLEETRSAEADVSEEMPPAASPMAEDQPPGLDETSRQEGPSDGSVAATIGEDAAAAAQDPASPTRRRHGGATPS